MTEYPKYDESGYVNRTTLAIDVLRKDSKYPKVDLSGEGDRYEEDVLSAMGSLKHCPLSERLERKLKSISFFISNIHLFKDAVVEDVYLMKPMSENALTKQIEAVTTMVKQIYSVMRTVRGYVIQKAIKVYGSNEVHTLVNQWNKLQSFVYVLFNSLTSTTDALSVQHYLNLLNKTFPWITQFYRSVMTTWSKRFSEVKDQLRKEKQVKEDFVVKEE